MDIVRGCRQAEMPICFKKYTGGYKMSREMVVVIDFGGQQSMICEMHCENL